MINVTIVGATGYTGGELIRILLNHPDVRITSAYSTKSMGLELSRIHRDLIGETELHYSNTLGNPDVLFLCLGHGLSRDFLDKNNISKSCKIIDLGNDFRVEQVYKTKSGDNLNFIYGLTDLNTDSIKQSNYIANPGCFATAIQLGLLPLAANNLVNDEVHVTGITGSTGAGKRLSDLSHFSYRENNISVYKPFTHQHLDEIKKTLSHLQQSTLPQINFVPIRGDFTRGIFVSIYTKWEGTADEASTLYQDYYKTSPFVFCSEDTISLKEVINTNKCLLHVDLHNGYIHITSIIDNLIKGASGQAVENMNLMFGLARDKGLKLKPIAF